MENVTRASMPATAQPAAMIASSRSVDESAGPDVRPDVSKPFSGQEIGPEEYRHVLRSVLQSSGIVLIGAYFTGDMSSASTLDVPTFLLHSHNARDLEAEADECPFAGRAVHSISVRGRRRGGLRATVAMGVTSVVPLKGMIK